MVSAYDIVDETANKVRQTDMRCEECGKRTTTPVYDCDSLFGCAYPACAEEGDDRVWFLVRAGAISDDDVEFSRNKSELISKMGQD